MMRAEIAQCERDGCCERGITYHRLGRTISNGPFNTSSSGLQAERPITLCAAHALDAFGVSFTVGGAR